MWCNQIFALLKYDGDKYTVMNRIVADNYEVASRIAKMEFGNTAITIDITRTPVNIGDTYKDGVFYNYEGKSIKPNPTEEEAIKAIQKNIVMMNAIAYNLDCALMMADETAIDLYEKQIVQDEVQSMQDEAIIELYEMIGGK